MRVNSIEPLSSWGRLEKVLIAGTHHLTGECKDAEMSLVVSKAFWVVSPGKDLKLVESCLGHGWLLPKCLWYLY